MCRAGGRRCKGGHSRTKTNQAARQRLSRANRALQAAQATGDPVKVEAAQQKLIKAQSEMDQLTQAHTRDTPDQTRDVTVREPVADRSELAEQFWDTRMPSAKVEMRQEVERRYKDKGIAGLKSRYRYLVGKANPSPREMAEMHILRAGITREQELEKAQRDDRSDRNSQTRNVTAVPTPQPTPNPALQHDPVPKPAPQPPVSGRMSDKPVTANGWGDPTRRDINFHEDGAIGTALDHMGPDKRMDVDGEPLADVLGRVATDVVTGRRTAQQGLDEYAAIRDRLPADSAAHATLSRAIDRMNAPVTPTPAVPDGTPEPLRQLITDLHAVPIVRRDPACEMNDLVSLANDAAAGRIRGARLAQQVKAFTYRRHESDGDAGKFEIDRAITRAVTDLRRPAAPLDTPTAPRGDVTPDRPEPSGRTPRIRPEPSTRDRPGGAGDVTRGDSPRAHAGDPPGGPPGTPRTRDVPGFAGMTVTNIVTGNAQVGIQTGVNYGNVVNGRPVSGPHITPEARAAVRQADRAAQRANREATDRRADGGTTNIVGGSTHIDAQIGVQYGDIYTD
jgi:hypothetical protein